MPLHAQKFFTKRLDLPFDDGIVVADTYYASPAPGAVQRLRIDFHSGLRRGEYTGLRLSIVHPQTGTIDTAVLSFVEHEVFRRRDTRLMRRPRDDGYGIFRDWNGGTEPPWHEGDFTAIRQAVIAYAQIWRPATAPSPTPARAASPTRTPSLGGTPRPPAVAARGGR